MFIDCYRTVIYSDWRFYFLRFRKLLMNIPNANIRPGRPFLVNPENSRSCISANQWGRISSLTRAWRNGVVWLADRVTRVVLMDNQFTRLEEPWRTLRLWRNLVKCFEEPSWKPSPKDSRGTYWGVVRNLHGRLLLKTVQEPLEVLWGTLMKDSGRTSVLNGRMADVLPGTSVRNIVVFRGASLVLGVSLWGSKKELLVFTV